MKKMKLFFTILAIMIFGEISSQNTFFVGNKTYKATPTWTFYTNECMYDNYPKVTVAKGSNGGYLVLTLSTPMEEFRIGGSLLIYLEDNTVIKCIDNKSRDRANNKETKIYNLTLNEIHKMASSKAISIRFNIKKFSTIESYIAENKYQPTFNESFRRDTKKYYDTELDISELYNL